MDAFGDHAITCVKNNFHIRHRFVVDALANVLTSAGCRIDLEVAITGKERPADILVHHLDCQLPMAIDVTAVHPLVRFDESGNGNIVITAEKEKHRHYDAMCEAFGVAFSAFGVSTFGTVGADASNLLRHITGQFMRSHVVREGSVISRQPHERIIVASMRGVGAQLAIMNNYHAIPTTSAYSASSLVLSSQVISGQANSDPSAEATPKPPSLAQAMESYVYQRYPHCAAQLADRLLRRSDADVHALFGDIERLNRTIAQSATSMNVCCFSGRSKRRTTPWKRQMSPQRFKDSPSESGHLWQQPRPRGKRSFP